MRNYISLAALICLILTKADYKLLKQQLFNNFWKYLSIGELLWNLKFSTHFEFPIGTWNILNVSVSCVLSWLWEIFLYKSGSRVIKFTSIQSKSISNQRCYLSDWPWNLNLASFLLLFAAMNFKSFRRILTTCSHNPCSIAIRFMLFFYLKWYKLSFNCIILTFIKKSSGKISDLLK